MLILSVAIEFTCLDIWRFHMSKYNYTSLENRVIINLKRLPDHPWATISEVEYLCVVAK